MLVLPQQAVEGEIKELREVSIMEWIYCKAGRPTRWFFSMRWPREQIIKKKKKNELLRRTPVSLKR